MLLFEMLPIDSVPIAAPMAAWCAIEVGIYGAETGIAAKITVVTPFTPLAICCGERRENSTCFHDFGCSALDALVFCFQLKRNLPSCWLRVRFSSPAPCFQQTCKILNFTVVLRLLRFLS